MNSTDASASASTTPQPTAYAQIVELARDSRATHAYFSKALGVIARTLGSPYAVVHLQYGSEIVDDEHHSGAADPAFWRSACQQLLTETISEGRALVRVLGARGAALRIMQLSAPVVSPQGAPIGALVVVAPADGADARQSLAFLSSLTALMAYCAEFVHAAPQSVSTDARGSEQALARAAELDSPAELAFSLTNALRNKLGCEQVSLGLVSGRGVRLLSISGLDDVRSRSPGVALVRSAMEECLDLGAVVTCGPEGGWVADGQPAAYRLHKAWHDAARAAAVASIPLHVGGRCVAIVSLRRSGPESFGVDEISRVRSSVEPFAAALLLLRDARRGLAQHAIDALRRTVASLLAPGAWGRRVALVAGLAAAAWVAFGTMQYDVAAPCRVAPAVVRHVTAPFDGVLTAVHADPGARVSAGDVLCTLDVEELQIERDELRAEALVSERARQVALASAKPVDARLEESRGQVIAARLAAVERRIAAAAIRSPVDGVIVSGDLRVRLSGAMRRGEPLFEVAPVDGWRIEIDAPQWAAGDIERGQAGLFSGNARPDDQQPLRVTRIAPTTASRGGRSVYVVEADFAGPHPPWVKAGMEGVARVSVGRRPVWWLATHRVLSYAHQQFWF